LTHYNLSFVYAIRGDLSAAEKEFGIANGLDSYKDYDHFIDYKIRSLENLVSMGDSARQWFEIHRLYLETN
jgi:hypothetical protein